jgi:23S rRNA (uracil1939-C5)-methyltransferase
MLPEPKPRSAVGPGDNVEVTIERIVPGGLGIARLAEQTLFVSFAAPGDQARVRINRVQGRTAFGDIAELVAPSAQRAEPVCRYFGRCGGCDFQHLSYESQLAAKVGIIEDCLRRIAGITDPPAIEITPSPKTVAHRSRAEWQISVDGSAVGYFERDSHTIIDVEECPVLVPDLKEAFERVRSRADRGTKGASWLKQIHAATAGGSISVSPPYGGLTLETLKAEISSEQYQYNAECFFQTNHGILPSLIEEALRFADEASHESRVANEQAGGMAKSTAVDLYSGVGLFTIPLARWFDRVTAVEIHGLASSFAEKNVAAAGLSNVRQTSMPVDRWLATRGRSLRHVGLAIVDPPRSGLDKAVVEGLARMRPTRIAYVSCDPATLARDINGLIARGYELERVAAFDMFPQTHHVEIVAHLKRKD